MVCRGHYCAITENLANQLRDASDDEVLRILDNEIGDATDGERTQAADKAWDAIHRCLTDGTLNCTSGSILEKCVLGGEQLYNGHNYVISLTTPDEVVEIAEATRSIARDWFRTRYFGMQRKFLWFTYSNYDGWISEEDFDYSWSYFELIRDFVARAASAKKFVVFMVDQ